jgi:protein-disulfide isomerase
VESLQQQIDELKENQQHLIKEVAEIKKLLEQRMSSINSSNKPAVPSVSTANIHGEPFRGTNTARIAIIEYSDFGCSFCGRYAREIYPQIDQEYVRSGKVRYYFRDLPEPNETNSWFKARAARCAGDQDKFWEMHDLLFAAQNLSGPDLDGFAQTLGLDRRRFDECLATEKYLNNIQRSADGARRMGLLGTPAFLIGTVTEDGDFVRVKKVMVGAENFNALKSALDELLSLKN